MTFRPRATRTVTTFFAFVALTLSGFPSGLSTARAVTPNIPGVWCSREPGRTLSTEQRQLLTRSLGRITGWEKIQFSAHGLLLLNEVADANGGSSIARQILTEVLRSGAAFLIEDHSRSHAVDFGQLDEGTVYEDGEHRLMIWRVRVDFDDFRQMQAPTAVRAAFDEGFMLLHEMLHGLGLKDTKQVGEIGECESVLNRARAELGLPLRDDYFGQALRLTSSVISAKLRFKSRSPGNTKWKWHYLYFLPGRESLEPFTW